MRRFTIYYRFGHDFLPMVNCVDIKRVGEILSKDEDGLGFKVYDNQIKEWVDPETVFLACVFSGFAKNPIPKS